MKVFILTTVMAPYRVQLFSEIGKRCELYVCFEQMRSAERDEKWYDDSSENFNFVELKKWDAPIKAVKTEVIRHIRNIRPDIVIAYEYHTSTSLVMMSYCQLMHIPYIINCDGAFISKSIKDIVKKFYINKAQGFISSGRMADKYLMHYGARESCIYFNHFTSLHDKDILKNIPLEEEKVFVRKAIGITERQVVISVGQFVHRKGYDVLLKAAANLPRNIGIYIIGGKPTQEYGRILDEFNLKNVHFVDFMAPEELRRYFLAADLFVLPTREDIWGLVINEAMACALPIVTTERCVAGIELIKHGANGYIVPVDDHMALSSAISEILVDNSMKNNMSTENLKVIRKYTYEVSAMDVMSAIESVYASVYKNNSASL